MTSQNSLEKAQAFFKLGIVGYPLSHTLSPVLHAELLRQAGLFGEYLPYEVAPLDLAKTIQQFANSGGRGLNVTIPHKVAVMPLLDQVNENAHLLGAVNTVIFSDAGEMVGENTDITGFMRSLPTALQNTLPESRVLLLGAGGSARAVIAGLLKLHTAHITIMARQLDKAEALKNAAEDIKLAFKMSTEIEVSTFADAKALLPFHGIINSTPVGMWPHADESPLDSETLTSLLAKDTPSRFVYDLIYRPQETCLLTMAKELGVETFNGLDMLILQGVAAFELWAETTIASHSVIESLRELLLTKVHS